MGVRILEGNADGHTTAAAMYCSTSGWMIGTIFEAEDAAEQVEVFLGWLSSHRWYAVRETIFGGDRAFALGLHWNMSGDDPRHWNDGALGKLIAYWRAEYVGADGWLLDPHLCACGHTHSEGDEDGSDAGCTSPGCGCADWKPGNRAAADLADGGKILA